MQFCDRFARLDRCTSLLRFIAYHSLVAPTLSSRLTFATQNSHLEEARLFIVVIYYNQTKTREVVIKVIKDDFLVLPRPSSASKTKSPRCPLTFKTPLASQQQQLPLHLKKFYNKARVHSNNYKVPQPQAQLLKSMLQAKTCNVNGKDAAIDAHRRRPST